MNRVGAGVPAKRPEQEKLTIFVHKNVTISAIFVCTFYLGAPIRYTLIATYFDQMIN